MSEGAGPCQGAQEPSGRHADDAQLLLFAVTASSTQLARLPTAVPPEPPHTVDIDTIRIPPSSLWGGSDLDDQQDHQLVSRGRTGRRENGLRRSDLGRWWIQKIPDSN